ncbi:MAG TPA: hypothetical protein ENG66_06380 [Thermococcus sp.]|nr:hypothetical protein [Thermococcus sp.]
MNNVRTFTEDMGKYGKIKISFIIRHCSHGFIWSAFKYGWGWLRYDKKKDAIKCLMVLKRNASVMYLPKENLVMTCEANDVKSLEFMRHFIRLFFEGKFWMSNKDGLVTVPGIIELLKDEGLL